MLSNIRYNTIVVEDMDESVRFYTELMDFTIESKFDLGPGNEITLLRGKGDVMIELAKDQVHEVGFYSIGLDVTDMDATIAEITKRGGSIDLGPISITVGRLAFTHDPNGVRIALIEHC